MAIKFSSTLIGAFFSLRSVVNLDFHFQDCDYYFEQSLKLYYKRNNTPPPPKKNELRVHFLSSFILPGLTDDFSTLTIFVPRWLESGLKHVEQGVLFARNDLNEIKTALLNVLPQRSSKLGKISSGPLISLNHIGRKTKKTKKSKRTVNNLKIFKPTWLSTFHRWFSAVYWCRKRSLGAITQYNRVMLNVKIN